MDLSNSLSHADPLYRKLHRAFFAVCLLLGPLTMAVWFGTCPQLGDPGCPNGGGSMAVYSAFRTLNPLVMQIFLVANLLVSYAWPASYIGLGMIAMKRSPWLTTIGLAFGLAGGLPFGGVVAAQASLFYGMAQMDYTPLFVTITQHIPNWMFSTLGLAWGFGHQIGYILLGIALARSRVVPAWAGWLMVVSVPVMGPIAYGTHIGLLQVLGFVMVAIGSVPAALAMLNRRRKYANKDAVAH